MGRSSIFDRTSSVNSSLLALCTEDAFRGELRVGRQREALRRATVPDGVLCKVAFCLIDVAGFFVDKDLAVIGRVREVAGLAQWPGSMERIEVLKKMWT